MAACWPLQMPPTPKAVLISLADNANDQGHCWPSLTTISERTCFGRSAVIEAIKWLERHGVVKADRSDRYHTKYVIDPGSFEPTKLVREPDYSGKKTSPSNGALVRLADDEVREPDDEVREPDTNRQEPSRTITKSNRQKVTLDLSSWPSEPSPEILADWMAMRRRQRADVTSTVVKGFARELGLADAAGYTVDECLTECVVRNWRGFKLEWLQNAEVKPKSTAGPVGATSKAGQAIEALERMKRGNQRPDSGETSAVVVLGSRGSASF